MVVAITDTGVDSGVIQATTASALVSVLLFPMLATRMLAGDQKRVVSRPVDDAVR